MHCELCGKEISGKPKHVVIEGAELDTCAYCGNLGTEIRRPQASGGHKTKVAVRARTRYTDIYRQMQGELDPDFDKVVREARERAQLTQEQLAGKIMEKALVIKKVERKELAPDDRLRKKLEKALNIHLLIDVSADETRRDKYSENLTLGDIAVVKRRG
ncbi:MAG: multiprotein bridging factor aMBF1 [Euryarchaeota archaeon]|nr:multiprotein bridging factor aMBF1 [Euryarchaeota archaeon]